jgi:hypothetical protein
MRNKLMIDIETTGQAPGCRVLSFAAFGFSKTGEQVQIYKKLFAADQTSHGLTDEKETIEWWNNQDPAIRNEAFGGTENTAIAISEFKMFFLQALFNGIRSESASLVLWSRLRFYHPQEALQRLRVRAPVEILQPVRLPYAEDALPGNQEGRTEQRRTLSSRRRNGTDARIARIL